MHAHMRVGTRSKSKDEAGSGKVSSTPNPSHPSQADVPFVFNELEISHFSELMSPELWDSLTNESQAILYFGFHEKLEKLLR